MLRGTNLEVRALVLPLSLTQVVPSKVRDGLCPHYVRAQGSSPHADGMGWLSWELGLYGCNQILSVSKH